MLDKLTTTPTRSFGTEFLGAIGTFFIAILASLVIVLVAAGSGLVIGYLFSGTCVELLGLFGLGKYSLWQVAVFSAVTAIIIRPLVAVFK